MPWLCDGLARLSGGLLCQQEQEEQEGDVYEGREKTFTGLTSGPAAAAIASFPD